MFCIHFLLAVHYSPSLSVSHRPSRWISTGSLTGVESMWKLWRCITGLGCWTQSDDCQHHHRTQQVLPNEASLCGHINNEVPSQPTLFYIWRPELVSPLHLLLHYLNSHTITQQSQRWGLNLQPYKHNPQTLVLKKTVKSDTGFQYHNRNLFT